MQSVTVPLESAQQVFFEATLTRYALLISIKTVDTYRSRLLKKLHLHNNAELSRFAIQNRLIEA